MTKVTIPPITMSQDFKTKKEARQEAIRTVMAFINDEEILAEIKVEKVKNFSQSKKRGY